jgi:hypothetical protein
MGVFQRFRRAAARIASLAVVATIVASGVPLAAANDCDMPSSHCHRTARLIACDCDGPSAPATGALPLDAASVSNPVQTVVLTATLPAQSRCALTYSPTGIRAGRVVPLPILHSTLLI